MSSGDFVIYIKERFQVRKLILLDLILHLFHLECYLLTNTLRIFPFLYKKRVSNTYKNPILR